MNIAILLSGGTGSRLGASIPKQYIIINNRPIIYYSLLALIKNPLVDGIVIVAAKEWQILITDCISKIPNSKDIIFAEPGDTRQLSILNGLNKSSDYFRHIDTILIHDAARPLVSQELLNNCIRTCYENDVDGVMPVLKVKDTIYVSIDGKNVSDLLDRSTLYAGQAPEAFRFTKYIDAHKKLSKQELLKINGSSEIAHKAGMSIKLIDGESMNFKITDSTDLERFKEISNEGIRS